MSGMGVCPAANLGKPECALRRPLAMTEEDKT
jgi:hypothetical protein